MIKADLLNELVHDLKMRAEICCTLSAMVGRNLDLLEKNEVLSHPAVVRAIEFNQLHHQIYEVMTTIRELEGEIDEAS